MRSGLGTGVWEGWQISLVSLSSHHLRPGAKGSIITKGLYLVKQRHHHSQPELVPIFHLTASSYIQPHNGSSTPLVVLPFLRIPDTTTATGIHHLIARAHAHPTIATRRTGPNPFIIDPGPASSVLASRSGLRAMIPTDKVTSMAGPHRSLECQEGTGQLL